jgi:hypothetical protein
MKRFVILLALLAFLPAVARATPMLILDPANGAVSGTPGSTVGWGFTLTNDSGYLVPSSVVFCEGAFNSGCAATFGTFWDFAAQYQFNVVGSTLTQTFDNATQQGIGSFTINANAPTGVTDLGTIYMVYDIFSCDITDVNCNATQTAFSQLLSAPASVNVIASAGASTVPEPASIGLVVMGLSLLVARMRLSPRVSPAQV